MRRWPQPQRPGGPTDFNPRTREGCDDPTNRTVWGDVISTHAPVKGATGITRQGSFLLRISTHAPVKGATSAIYSDWEETLDFNPRTREGCDNRPEHPGIIMEVFQPTHP